jgi:outer membrane protein TolC
MNRANYHINFSLKKLGVDHKSNLICMLHRVTFALLFVIGFVCSSNAQSEDTWSLNRCVRYALKNNIDLNRQYNQVETQKLNLDESKANLFPDLNMGSSLFMNFGRNIDGNTNDVTYEQNLSNNYWLSSSVDIFQGLAKQNAISYHKFLLSAYEKESLVLENTLVVNVLTYYYTAVYSLGILDVAKGQVHLSEMQFQRMKKLVDVGKESPITVQELKSQWAADKLKLTQAQSIVSKSILELKQLLRLDATRAFVLDTLGLASDDLMLISPRVDSLFSQAVELMPEIKQQEYLMNASAKDLAVAKAKMYPRIYLSAGYNTNYFDRDSLSFSHQIENNQNQWINMGVVIPIFNNASVHTDIKRKKIALRDQQLQLEKQRETLYTSVWKAVDALNSAENEYKSALELHKFSLLTLKNVAKKLENGLASATDYEAAKQRLISAKASLLKARLIYVMRKQMLEFYQNGDWSHLNI